MHQFEVTQQQWTVEGLPNPSGLMANGTGDCLESDCPVGNVSWIEVAAFANLLSQKEGLTPCYLLGSCQGQLGAGMDCVSIQSTYASVYDCPGYRMPTGAEGEYAARAGTNTTVYTGDVLDTGHVPFTCYDEPVLLSIAWYCANAGTYTQLVGQLQPNDWGLFDMMGNAGEWTGSVAVTYQPGPYTDWSAELSISNLHNPNTSMMQIRGGGFNQWPNTLRVGDQGGGTAPARGPGVGFRLVQTLQ
jgi:formylglycine-generating enzyme required for sulfatase activity